MERSEVIAAAAQRLRAQHLLSLDELPPAPAFVRRVCDVLSFEIFPVDRHGVMLGGAHARIQFADAEHPELGGFIWVAADRWQSDPTFAAYAVAHELGHFILHRGERHTAFAPCAEDALTEEGDASLLSYGQHGVEEYAPQARREREANTFAAEMLAPRVLVRRLFAEERLASGEIAARLGISPHLAEGRLLAAILAPSRPREVPAQVGTDALQPEATAETLLGKLDAHQHAAATAPGPALVVAGPGTGKTATLIGRAGHLLTARGRQPEQVLALTFSNPAAGEMRERLMAAGLPGERMPVMTIHSFAALLLRDFASSVPHGPDEAPLAADFRLLDQADQFLLLEELLPELPLHYYRSLHQPTQHLFDLITNFSAARDALLTPEAYLDLVENMPLAPVTTEEAEAPTANKGGKRAKQKETPPEGTFTPEQKARARERAEAYRVYDRALRQRGLLDFGGLIQRAVELLRANPAVLATVRLRYPEVLVDEFQDTNAAAGELILLLAGDGAGLWVVGDANQSIYRWRGASPRNLDRLRERYSHLGTYHLVRCYRSIPEIVALGSHIAGRMRELGPSPLHEDQTSATPGSRSLEPDRVTPDHALPVPAAREVALPTCEAEHAYLAASIRAAQNAGYPYREQAILCRSHKRKREVAAALEAAGVPVAMVGDFFARMEVKDALCLLTLAAGHDASPLMRAGTLLRMVGVTSVPGRQLGPVVMALSRARLPLPYGLTSPERLREVIVAAQRASAIPIDGSVMTALLDLGQVATRLHRAERVGFSLARALLEPGGYAWQLACRADRDEHVANASATSERDTLTALRPAEAQTSLAALGALVSVALSFDTRWRNEPDFRQRLSRATNQGTVGFVRSPQSLPQPAQPDALELPPADVLPDAQVGDAQTHEGVHLEDVPRGEPAQAPAVAAFLHYLVAMRAAKVSITIPAPEDDTVRVMTLHSSKGLEFPIVYLPYLVKGRFPAQKSGREDPNPPGFRELDAPGQEEAEEQCLFYVGVTRARDQIVLTRAERYSKSATRSPLLQLVEGAEVLNGGAMLPPTSVSQDTQELPSNDEDGEEAEPLCAEPAVPLTSLPTFSLWELELYNECPRKYKYSRRYGFYDTVRGAANRFHRFVRQGQRVLREVAEGQSGQPTLPETPFEAVQPQLRAAWQEQGPVGHAYEDFYWRHAEAILRQEWVALAAQSLAPGMRNALAREVTATLSRCRVTVTADELREEPASGTGSQPRYTLVRQRTGLPAQSHRDDLTLPLYALAVSQEHPDADVRVVLRYLGNALRADDPDEHPGETIDLTDEATKAAQKYTKPNRTVRSTLDKLDEATDAIQAGKFPAKPDEHKCAECAFCYLCPADPTEEVVAPIPVRVHAEA